MTLPYLLTPNNMHFKLRVIIISCECSIFKMNPWNLFHFLSLVFFVLADQFIDQIHQALWITSIPVLKRLKKIGTKVFRNNVLASNTGLEKSVVWSSKTTRFSFWASNFSFSLAWCASDQTSCLPTKSLKEHSKNCPRKQNLSANCLRASWNSSFF